MSQKFFIDSIDISNFKMIENMSLSFSKGFNLLIGDNGAGKTTVLEAITVALGGFLVGMEDVATRNIYKDDVHYDILLDSNRVANKIYRYPVEVSCNMTCDNENFFWKRTRKDGSNSKTTMAPREILKYSQQIVNSSLDNMLPLLSYASASRHWISKRSDANIKTKKRLHDRRCAYLDCLDSMINMQSIYDWCIGMEFSMLHEGKADNYKEFCKIVAKFMDLMNETEGSEFYYDLRLDCCFYKNKGVIKDINDLSAGYQSIFKIIIELAYRAAILNPEAGKDIANVSGVVLIDEIDSNLHPRWQWLIADTLTAIFPNIQFIATTHSPIILSACRNANIIKLFDNGEINTDRDVFGYSVNDILEGVFGKISRPGLIEKKMKSFYDYLYDENYDDAEEVLSDLRKTLGDSHPLVSCMISELKLEKMEL